ncbi:MAG TPA: ATP-binding cassette domain-containing protein [Candidatus Nitrosotenuis sp.]|nr:ATP-binding cassette domain-containing protein [Candidatus Nitrosotenuis sp.]
MLGWSFFIALLNLITPLFMRGIYDFVIPSFSSETLIYLGIGLGIALFVLYVLEEIKAKVVAYVGARLDVIISTEIMRHLLFIPMQYMEGATVAAQVARLRQFDSIREIFTGPFAHLAIEIPFIVVFIIALAVLGGPVAFVPMVTILVYAVVGFLLFPYIRQTTLETSRALQERRTFFIETIANLPFVKQLAAEDVWLKRYRETGAHSSLSSRRSERVSFMMINLSQVLLKVSGVATILWSALRVLDGTMTVGSLIAVVILVWRALSPIHTVFLILSRLDQIRDSINQVNRLMTIPMEKHSPRPKPLRLQGHVRFNGITFRYPADTTPAIQGINFEVPPGEILAIVGNNGSGKTTLAKLMLGLYPSQVGQVTIDGMDVRQYDPIQLRQSIGYAPHLVQFFHGSIAQNMRLVNPEASEQEILTSLEKVDLRRDVENLPKGINTRIDDRFLAQYSSGFLQKLNLARAFIRKSNLLIFDEPGNNLDIQADNSFKRALLELKGQATIICITHRPSLINIADRILMLHNGFTRAYGPKDKVLAAISGGQV